MNTDSVQTRTELVLFDMDGVLVLSEPLHYQSWFYLAEEIGFSMQDFMSFEESIGISENDVSRQLVETHKLDITPEEVVKRKRYYFMKQAQENGIQTPDGLTEFIDYCKNRYRLGLVSSSSRESVEAVIRICGLEKYFELLVTGDDVQNHKPAPDPYQLALSIAGVSADKAVAIEDSANGINSAKSAGIEVLVFKTNFNDLMNYDEFNL